MGEARVSVESHHSGIQYMPKGLFQRPERAAPPPRVAHSAAFPRGSDNFLPDWDLRPRECRTGVKGSPCPFGAECDGR